LAVTAAALAVAAVSARPYAASYNDGSRLATVECLVDYHTLAIDESVFVQVPPADSGRPCPYCDDYPELLQNGTGDKMFIRGHFYSDKSPVPALLMAGLYQVLQGTTGLVARDRPDRFCYWLTLGSSGLAYAIAVGCVYRLGLALRLALPLCLGLTASFALATVALPYVEHVNNHILLLGVAAALMLGLVRLADAAGGQTAWGWLLGLGTLAGLGYSIDLGTGPVLFVCTLAAVAWRVRRWRPLAVFVAAALPWLALHHAVNYAVGGTFKPANAVPEYFQWPGCPLPTEGLTGGWKHASLADLAVYLGGLLVGNQGFLWYNLPLWLALPGAAVLLWRRVAETPELLFAVGWSAGTWLLYGVASNNYSGYCCSIRWFVPLLAPGYFVLAVFLRDYPRRRKDFAVLSAGGLVLGILMWRSGPWSEPLFPDDWFVPAGTAAGWLACGLWDLRARTLGARLNPPRESVRPAGQPQRQG
jgi:hypothetical protein